MTNDVDFPGTALYIFFLRQNGLAEIPAQNSVVYATHFRPRTEISGFYFWGSQVSGCASRYMAELGV
jgi:hypothetical protein